MEKLFHHILDFLAAHDFPTLMDAIHKLEWTQVLRNPFTWLVGLPILVFLIWTKKIKTLVAVVSCFLFLLLIQKTFSGADGMLSLHDLFIFLGGAVALIGVNLYLILVRQ